MDTTKLETALEDIFVKKAPALPQSAKKVLVDIAPWITLVLGVLSLWSAYWLWQWAHTVNRIADYVNQWSAALGAPVEPVSRMSFFVWLSLVAMVLQAAIYIIAFSPLKERKISGWKWLFYALLLNVVVGLVGLFNESSYGGFGGLLGTLVGAAIGLYFLFQLKSEYQGKKAVAAVSETKPEEKK